MTAQPTEWIVDNAAREDATPRLSILIPFHRDDPCGLLEALDGADRDIEIVLLDDGSGDPDLAERVAGTLRGLARPARLVSLSSNEGRARGRNRLVRHGRGRHLLLLDADMLPDTPTFTADWLALIGREDPAVAFGGFSLDQTPVSAANAVHRAMALKGDCLPAAVRSRTPEKYVFTSNLLVRRDVFESVGFDEAFTGWGWEDVEWAIRVSRAFPIRHVDIPASHLGLDDAPTIARKYRESVGNFARVVQAHRRVVEGWPTYRAARMLRILPLPALWRALFRAAALTHVTPVTARAMAMRFYRASLYTEVV